MRTVERENRRTTETLVLAALVLLALAARLVLVIWADRAIRWDEPDYLYLARSLAQGNGFAVAGHPELHYAPLFPAVASVAFRVLGDLKAASDAVYVVAGALLIWPFYLLVRQLFGRPAAVASAFLLALCPALNAWVLYWGTMTEPLFLLCVFTGLWFTWRALDGGRIGHAAAAGVSFSLGYLTRPEGSLYVALGVAILLVAMLVQKQTRSRRAYAALGVYVAAALVTALPYQVFLYQNAGRWMVSGKLGVTYDIGKAVLARDPAEYDRVTASLDSTGSEIIWYSPERFERDLAAELSASPMEALRRVGSNARALLGAWFDLTVFPTLLLIFVGLAWFAQPWDRRRLGAELYWTAALIPLLVAFLPFHIEIRFFAAALPVAMAWVGRGAIALGEWAADTLESLWAKGPLRRSLRVLLVAAPTLLIAGAFVGLTVLAVGEGRRSTDFTHRSAGLWLKERSPANSVVLSRDLAIALYADREWVPSPRAEMPEFLAYARAHGAGYVVVDEREITVIRPFLSSLLEPETTPSELELVYECDGGKGRVFVYALKGGAGR